MRLAPLSHTVACKVRGHPAAFFGDVDFSKSCLSTQPPQIEAIGFDWGYCAPRNGHISLFSRRSMTVLREELGVKLGFFDDYNQMVWRDRPACFTCFVKNAAPT